MNNHSCMTGVARALSSGTRVGPESSSGTGPRTGSGAGSAAGSRSASSSTPKPARAVILSHAGEEAPHSPYSCTRNLILLIRPSKQKPTRRLPKNNLPQTNMPQPNPPQTNFPKTVKIRQMAGAQEGKNETFAAQIFSENSAPQKLRRKIYPAAKRLAALMIIDFLLQFAVVALSAVFLFCTQVLVQPAAAQTQKLSGQDILKRVDDNITADNKIMTAKMIIHLRRASRTVEFKSYIQGTEKAFTEYLAPPRERGTKMLKLGNQLWMYSPWTERTILISGHMLRQSVMGSDLSYEDMMEDPRLSNSYAAELVGEEVIRLGEGLGSEQAVDEPGIGIGSNGSNKLFANYSLVSRPAGLEFSGEPGYENWRYENLRTEIEEYQAPEINREIASPQAGQAGFSSDVVARGTEVSCWVLELTARSEDVAYQKRKLWVDKERFVVVREERYARGGTLLKKTEVLSLKRFGKRWVPDRAVFKDMLKAGEGTEFVIDSIEFDARIPDYIFTRAALK